MRVTVRFFARLRDIIGSSELDRNVPTGATVRVLWDGLVAEYPDINLYASSISSAVNAEYTRLETVLHDGDEVAFLPPVSGGAAPPETSVTGARCITSLRPRVDVTS